MTPLEPIVRPFSDVTAPAVRGVTSVPQPSTNVTLVVTGGGSVKSAQYSYSYSFQDYADAKQNEQTGSS